MDRIYRVIAIRRDGVWQYWEPVIGQFTFKEIPTIGITNIQRRSGNTVKQ